MYLLGLGCLLLALKLLEFGPVADLSWWWVMAPFGLAVLWWTWADASGYTKRKASEDFDKKREERRARIKDSIDNRPRS